MMKKAKRSKTQEDWITVKIYRNECLTRIRRAKADFVTSELENNINDSKKFSHQI